MARLVTTSANYLNFFRRWRAKANLVGIWDTITPVAVVDRFRGPGEGSMYAMTMESGTAGAEFPSVFFGVEPPFEFEMELHALQAWVFWDFGAESPVTGGPHMQLHLFTPSQPYDPVANLNPVGVFRPAMFLDPSFTLGHVVGFAGTNPLPSPLGIGYNLVDFDSYSSLNWNPLQAGFSIRQRVPITGVSWATRDGGISPVDNMRTGGSPIAFDPPIRLPATVGLACQFAPPLYTTQSGLDSLWGLRVTIFYHEREVGPGTGPQPN